MSGAPCAMARAERPTSKWVVERTLAWLNRNRRLAKDYNRRVATLITQRVWIFFQPQSYFGIQTIPFIICINNAMVQYGTYDNQSFRSARYKEDTFSR